jgi:hypothetical protein
MIGIGGLARSGKDTLAQNLADIIEADMGCEVRTYSFALPIKRQMSNLLEDYYNISAFTDDTEEKLIIRPLLVAHGEQMKEEFGKDIWLKELLGAIYEDLRYKEFFPIISDVRFDFEAEALKKERDAAVIHLSKIGNEPPNDIESKNDPLVKAVSDLSHTWPEYKPNDMKQCHDHAQILWQMLKESHGEKWKKIYN